MKHVFSAVSRGPSLLLVLLVLTALIAGCIGPSAELPEEPENTDEFPADDESIPEDDQPTTQHKTGTVSLEDYAAVGDVSGGLDYIPEAVEDDKAFCAGDRAYMVNMQDGMAADIGYDGAWVGIEQGGVWSHPIKLMDGFWVQIQDSETGEETWLGPADTFTNLPHANRFTYTLPELGLAVERFEFCPNGMRGIVVEYEITDTQGETRNLVVTFVGRSDLLPHIYPPETAPVDGPDHATYRDAEGVIHATDANNPWHAVFGSDRDPTGAVVDATVTPPQQMTGENAVTAEISYDVTVDDRSTLPLYVAGSHRSGDEALDVFETLVSDHERLREGTEARYQALLNRGTLTVPDDTIQTAYEWAKFHREWLTLDIPGLGRGFTGNMPTYTWFFGIDNTYAAIPSALAQGEFETAKDTLRTIRGVAEDRFGDGRTLHEVMPGGDIVPATAHSTPDFAIAVWRTYQWSGDAVFLEEMYPFVLKGLDYMESERDLDGDGLPEGDATTEVVGYEYEMIDAAVTLQQAYTVAAEMSRLIGDGKADAFQARADELEETINERFWLDEEGTYAEMIATEEELFWVIDDLVEERAGDHPAIVNRLEQIRDELYEKDAADEIDRTTEKPWILAEEVIMLSPVEFGIAPMDRALSALKARDAGYESGENGAHQTQAECVYDRQTQCLESIRFVAEDTKTWNYGIPEVWMARPTVYSLTTEVLGIKPAAAEQQVTFRPHLPAEWDTFSIERVRVGDNAITYSLHQDGNDVIYTIESTEDGWTFTLVLPARQDTTYTVNGEPATPDLESDGEYRFHLTDLHNTVTITSG